MEIRYNSLLAPYTSFYIGGPADVLVFVESEDDVLEAINIAEELGKPLFFLGGGSNVLISDEGFRGVAVRMEIFGIDVVKETGDSITIEVGAGEKWDDIVRMACDEGWWGIENLSHIPGTVGGFPVQNVGAYGQEASQVVEYVKVLNRESKKIEILDNKSLMFGYRSSILNRDHKDDYIVLACAFKLSKTAKPNLSYRDLSNKFSDVVHPTLSGIRSAVIEIRNKKYPFPDKPTNGSAGSFFRGPVLSQSEFDELLNKLTSKNGAEVSKKLEAMAGNLKVAQGYKTPAAFLLDISEVKGLASGGAMINEEQPAVILNFTGEATANDVISLYKSAKEKVFEQTGVSLTHEPEFIGFSEPIE